MIKKFEQLPNNPKDTSKDVLAHIDNTSKLWKLGKTKVRRIFGNFLQFPMI